MEGMTVRTAALDALLGRLVEEAAVPPTLINFGRRRMKPASTG